MACALADAYGWGPQEVLALTMPQAAMYLEHVARKSEAQAAGSGAPAQPERQPETDDLYRRMRLSGNYGRAGLAWQSN